MKYLFVGGWAVGLYGNSRATKDIDFLISVDDDNLKKLKKAFCEFGTPAIDMIHFKETGNFFRMGRSPVQIDIITEASGIDIKEKITKGIQTTDYADVYRLFDLCSIYKKC